MRLHPDHEKDADSLPVTLIPHWKRLALCTNLVMAYNTRCLQCALDTLQKSLGREIDASIQRFISPMGFEHINFNGVLVFPFEHYRAQLLSPRRGFRAQSARH